MKFTIEKPKIKQIAENIAGDYLLPKLNLEEKIRLKQTVITSLRLSNIDLLRYGKSEYPESLYRTVLTEFLGRESYNRLSPREYTLWKEARINKIISFLKESKEKKLKRDVKDADQISKYVRRDPEEEEYWQEANEDNQSYG